MYNKLFFIFFYIFSNCVFGQVSNLIQNPSFEDYSQCPDNGSQIFLAKPWSDCMNGNGSSDFLHCCASNGSIYFEINYNQFPRTGLGEASIILFGNYLLDNYREYIGVELKENLKANKKYCPKLYVSLNNFANYAIENIGMYFSPTQVIQSTLNAPLPYIPQVQNLNGIIKDTMNWISIGGNFIATGSEKYLIIGNFNSNQQTNHLYIGGTSNPRYFIDDVSVCDCDDFKPKLSRDTLLCTGQQLLLNANIPKEADSVIYTWQDGSKDSIFMVTQPGIYWVSAYIEDYKIKVTDTVRVNYTDCTPPKYPLWIPNSFTPNGDGLNDIFKPETIAELENYSMLIFNRWGQQIFESNDISKGWDGKYKGKAVPLGVYTYHIEATDKLTKEKKVYNGRVTLIF